MPRVKPSKKKPAAYACLFDQGVYEVYVDNVLISSFRTLTESRKEARQHKRPRASHPQVVIRYKSICTWGSTSGPDICKYWKNCVESKGTTFTQPWGKKQLMLLEMKRQAKQSVPEPKKDRELDQFS